MKKNIYLFQPQSTVGPENIDTPNYWLPYSTGCLWSYAYQFDFVKENFTLGELFYSRLHPDEVLGKLVDPVLCGFSCYIWNERYCIEIARLIKEKFPNCKIVFGGPNTNARMLKYDFIDSLVFAEGEETFVSILKSVVDNQPLEEIYTKKRLSNLDIPSPYTTGVFDQLIADNPKVKWFAVIETNRGCPYQCTFCDWGSNIYSKVRKFNLEKIFAELEWIAKNPITFLYGGDANFGMFKDRDIEIAKKIRWVTEVGMLGAVIFNYAKHSNENVFLIDSIIGNASKGVTLSLQSLNDSTLDAVKRKNMSINNVENLIALSRKYNVPTYTELIIGLPEETAESWKIGIGQLLEIEQDQIDVFWASLLEHSEMNSLDSKTKYGLTYIEGENYLPNISVQDYNEIKEVAHLITSTNTMSFDDLVDSYIFSWLVIHLHCSSYIKMFSKFCRDTLGISYYKFYSKFVEKLSDHSEIHEHVTMVASLLATYLKTGRMYSADNNMPPPFVRNGETNLQSYKWFYFNRNLIIELAKDCAQEFTDENIDWLIDLNLDMIYSPEQTFPKVVTYPYDIDTWEKKDTEYLITTKCSETDMQKFNFYIHERKKKLVNCFTKTELLNPITLTS
jgi:hypothetical protein